MKKIEVDIEIKEGEFVIEKIESASAKNKLLMELKKEGRKCS